MTYAGAIAARLQVRREDEDMAGRTRKTVEPVASVWNDETLASRVAEVVYATVSEALSTHRTEPPLHERADEGQEIADLRAENDELRTKLAQAESAGLGEGYEHEGTRVELQAAHERIVELERERDEARERLFGLESNDDHVSCYVAREVPWGEVGEGMMTIARDGTPWMVETWRDVITVRLRNGDRTFDKTPVDGETVRVLVPYVTPEQAQALVASELGGRA